MTHKVVINTLLAPSPIGPYSQAILANNMLFASGQIAINPATGDIIDKTIEEETHQVMRNIKAILEEAQMTFDNVVKTSIFLSDMDYFSKVNDTYAQYFKGQFPARETIAVKNLPKNVNIEISITAFKS